VLLVKQAVLNEIKSSRYRTRPARFTWYFPPDHTYYTVSFTQLKLIDEDVLQYYNNHFHHPPMLILLPLFTLVILFLDLLGLQKEGTAGLSGWRIAIIHAALITGIFIAVPSEFLSLFHA
jgi:hypothetical protein